MHKAYLNYPGLLPGDNWVKIADHQFKSRHNGQLPPNTYPWDSLPGDIELKKDLCVQVIGEDPKIASLPRFVREAEDIVYLSIPLQLLPKLKSADIPETVRTLALSGEGAYELKPDFAVPRIERLLVATHVKLLFANENFPNLHFFGGSLDGKRKMLSRLVSFPNLCCLIIGPCPRDIFTYLEKLKLGYLRINDNVTCDTLNGIESLGVLTHLWVHKWTRLADLSALARLPDLEDLTLAYCKKIENAEALSRIPNLKRLFTWKCDSRSVEQLVPALEKKNLQELSVS